MEGGIEDCATNMWSVGSRDGSTFDKIRGNGVQKDRNYAPLKKSRNDRDVD